MTAAAAVPTAGDPAATGTAAGPSAPKPSARFANKLNPMSLFTKTNPQTGAQSRTLPGPSQIKDFLGTGGGIATLLRSILTFLRTRFPMLAGTNALMSMGLSSKLLIVLYLVKLGLIVRSLDAAAMVLPQARPRGTSRARSCGDCQTGGQRSTGASQGCKEWRARIG
jgi:hypothetical protein